MKTVHATKKTGADGILHFHIQLEKPDSEFEVVVVVQPKENSIEVTMSDELGWPSGYFESTYGSISDETFVRPAQGELPRPVDFE